MVWIIGLFAAALLLNGFFIYYIHRRNHTHAARWRMQAVLLQAKENLTEYSALPWLISFWKEEGSTLELPGDFDERRDILRRAFLSLDIDSVKEVTGLQAGLGNLCADAVLRLAGAWQGNAVGIEYILHKPGAVKAAGCAAAPDIGNADVFSRGGNNGAGCGLDLIQR